MIRTRGTLMIFNGGIEEDLDLGEEAMVHVGDLEERPIEVDLEERPIEEDLEEELRGEEEIEGTEEKKLEEEEIEEEEIEEEEEEIEEEVTGEEEKEKEVT